MNRPLSDGVVIERKGGASVVLRAPGEAALLCPRCWTAQRADRAFCWHCGADFIWQSNDDDGRTGKAMGE